MPTPSGSSSSAQDAHRTRHAPTLDRWTGSGQHARHDPRQAAARVIVNIYNFGHSYMNYKNSRFFVNDMQEFTVSWRIIVTVTTSTATTDRGHGRREEKPA